jgi:SAM-dependent methyltransferase
MATNAHKVSPGHPLYRRAVAREAKWWGRVELERRRRTPREHPLIAAYENRCATGDDRTSWMDLVGERFGQFAHACSLGSGIGVVEERLLRDGVFARLDVFELSGEAIGKLRARLAESALGARVTLCECDLNFVQLPPERYDAVLCHTILHHLVNVEHIAAQINHSLRPGGVAIICDYVGEARFQWAEEKLRRVNALLGDLPATYGPPRLVRPDRRTLARRTPFEAIRSDEVLGILSTYLQPEQVGSFAPIVFPLAAALLHDFDWDDEPVCRVLARGCDADQQAMREGRLRPCRTFGLYRKRERPSEPDVPPWTEAEIRDRLGFRSGPQQWLHRKWAAWRGGAA